MQHTEAMDQLKSWANRWKQWVGPSGDESRYKNMATAAELGADAIAERDQLRAELAATQQERTAIAAHVERLVGVLKSIWNWEMPETGDVWEDGTPMSYAAAYGSNGERRVIREKAYDAIAATPAQSLAAAGRGAAGRDLQQVRSGPARLHRLPPDPVAAQSGLGRCDVQVGSRYFRRRHRRGNEGGEVTIYIPEWLLWGVETVAALVVLFFGVVGLIAFRSLRGPFWR